VDDRVLYQVKSCKIFEDASRVVFLEQLAKHRCKQFNVNLDGAFCDGFARRIRQNALIQKAVEYRL
jgi:hypothetical protein